MHEMPIVETVARTCFNSGRVQDARTFLKIASDACTELVHLDRVAYLQSEIKDYASCISSLQKCMTVAVDEQSKYAIRANMAKMYNHINEPILSMECSRQNQQVRFDFDTLMEIAFSYYLDGNYAESEKMMRELVSRNDLPENVRGRVEYNLGSYDLERGEFKAGLRGFVGVGHKIGLWQANAIPGVPMWQGEDIAGKQIIIHASGGIGDEIINFRFTKNLKDLGAIPIWNSKHARLAEVFERHGVQTSPPTTLENTVQCMALFLPVLLDLDKDQVWSGLYLTPNPEYIEKWSKILPSGPKLAVKWSGNPMYDQDLHRSIPIEHIRNIQYNGTKVNLQLEPELFQLDMFNAGQHITNIEDTLAILWLCDEFISSCTSVVHMNGAMGKNGIVCPPIAAYYVWIGDAKWYADTLRVVRQTARKDWKFVETLL